MYGSLPSYFSWWVIINVHLWHPHVFTLISTFTLKPKDHFHTQQMKSFNDTNSTDVWSNQSYVVTPNRKMTKPHRESQIEKLHQCCEVVVDKKQNLMSNPNKLPIQNKWAVLFLWEGIFLRKLYRGTEYQLCSRYFLFLISVPCCCKCMTFTRPQLVRGNNPFCLIGVRRTVNTLRLHNPTSQIVV